MRTPPTPSFAAANSSRRSWALLLLLACAWAPALGCDDTPTPAPPAPDLTDHCPELVAKVKEQCGADSLAFKKQKQLYLDNAPQGEPTGDNDAQMRVRRLMSCKAGLAAANEKLDYSEPPNFTVGDDPELQSYAKEAQKGWEARKAAYQTMSPEERKKDEAAQLEQRCQLWILG